MNGPTFVESHKARRTNWDGIQYLGCDPVRDVRLHGADMFFGIINGDKEVSHLPIQIIIKL